MERESNRCSRKLFIFLLSSQLSNWLSFSLKLNFFQSISSNVWVKIDPTDAQILCQTHSLVKFAIFDILDDWIIYDRVEKFTSIFILRIFRYSEAQKCDNVSVVDERGGDD